MNVICADDERLALELLTSVVKTLLPDANVSGFQTGKSCVDYAQKNKCQIAFLDINLGQTNGIELAYKLKVINPRINIIFVTGYDEYYREAFELHASGYVLKPVTKEAIEKEIQALRIPLEEEEEIEVLPDMTEEVQQKSQNTQKLVIKTFGNFELFYNGQIVKFKRSKSKELLAYLVDRKGAAIQTKELVSILWEDETSNHNTRSQLQNLSSDIRATFKELGIEEAFIKGFNSYAINLDLVDCDYYKFLAGDVPAINSFMGEYMNNYSWGEFTLGALESRAM